jgi:PAB-dependent poly(A)-specific ribonuclease subunit 3
MCSEADGLDDDLSRELENGRLLRLLLKLGFVNERPEFDLDASWSETGDRYPLKLFRDYVFHQVDADGTPVLDLGHVFSTLNRLDAGDEHDRCTLVSRDGQTALVVSFADLRRSLEHAYADLEQRAAAAAGGPGDAGSQGMMQY